VVSGSQLREVGFKAFSFSGLVVLEIPLFVELIEEGSWCTAVSIREFGEDRMTCSEHRGRWECYRFICDCPDRSDPVRCRHAKMNWSPSPLRALQKLDRHAIQTEFDIDQTQHISMNIQEDEQMRDKNYRRLSTGSAL
jgi:hypothetical protein